MIKFLEKYRFIKRDEDTKFIYDYNIADTILRIFSILWLGHVFLTYQDILNRPKELFEPIIWVQQLLFSSIPKEITFYIVLLISIVLCIVTIFKKSITLRFLLFVLILILNTLKWNYNFFSHVGHLFVLTHLFTFLLPPRKIDKTLSRNEIILYSNSIRIAFAGILITYTMAGFWKFLVLFYKLIFTTNSVNWLSNKAIELNAIVSSRLWDEQISPFMLSVYEVPFVWQIGIIITFIVQLIAVLGAFNKKLSYLIVSILILFHIYNMIFINTFFYTSVFVLIILFLPYHLIKLKNLIKLIFE
jgi:hypothetical protein